MSDPRIEIKKIRKELECIKCAISDSAAGAATEATLASILSALDDDEIVFVYDDGAGNKIVRQVRVSDESGVITFSYEEIDGTPYVLVGSPQPITDDPDYLSLMVYDSLAVEWEARYTFDPQTGAWTIVYYDPSGASGVPTGGIKFTDGDIRFRLVNLDNNWQLVMEEDNIVIASAELLKTGGRAVDSSTYAPGYTANDAALLAFDITSGRLLVDSDGMIITSTTIFDDNYDTFERRLTYDPSDGSLTIAYFNPDGTSGTPSGTTLFADGYLANSIDEVYAALSQVKQTDNAAGNINSWAVGGKAVDTVTYSPAYTADDHAKLAIDKDNGGLHVNQANLALGEDEVQVHVGATDSTIGVPDDYRNNAFDETKVEVKSSGGNLYGWNFINPNTVPVYIKFYDLALASVTVGTSPVSKTLMVPAQGSVYQSPKVREHIFATSIVIAATTGYADSDTGALTTDIICEIKYK